MDSTNNELIPIPMDDWPHLMDMYRNANWPEHFVTFYTIKNYIEWKNSIAVTTTTTSRSSVDDNEFRFYALNGDWSDGTHMIIDNLNHVQFNTLNADPMKIVDLLKLIRWDGNEFLLYKFAGRLEPVVRDFMRNDNLIDGGGNMAYLYYLDKEAALQFDIRPPTGYIIKPLAVEHVKFVNDNWIYKHPGSEKYLEKLIKRNLQLGLFNEHDALVAWCLRVEYGLLGTLQVLETHKRRGFGLLLVKALAKLCAQHHMDSGAAMDLYNFTSQNLFEKAGFRRIGKFAYIMPKQK